LWKIFQPKILKSCNFSAFPDGCISYEGPHSFECYTNLWLKAGCIQEGFDRPETMSVSEKAAMDEKNLA